MPPEPLADVPEADDTLEALVEAVRSGPDYRNISTDLIRWVGRQELPKFRKLKDAVKSTRSRLHQTAAAYQDARMEYDRWLEELSRLPHEVHHPQVMDYCCRIMDRHASTRERLPILDTFFTTTLAAAEPLHSLLDIGCGMNPLAIPWMPAADDFSYIGLDIYADQADFLNAFLHHLRIPGEVRVHNILNGLPQGLPRPQTILLLKTLSCLEQLDKSISRRLLPEIQADYVLISYPLHSLGGHSKGMRDNYQAHFEALSNELGWASERYEFKTELAFIVKL